MITINGYLVTERAVVQGVTTGVEQLLKDINNFKDPEAVVQLVASAVMEELCGVFEFGQQNMRLTPDIIHQLYMRQQMLAAQATEPLGSSTNNPSPAPVD